MDLSSMNQTGSSLLSSSYQPNISHNSSTSSSNSNSTMTSMSTPDNKKANSSFFPFSFFQEKNSDSSSNVTSTSDGKNSFFLDENSNSNSQKNKNDDGNGLPIFTVKDMLNSLGVSPASKSSSLQGPPPSLEYLFEDEIGHLGPSFGSRLCYGTGITYLSGLAFGGLWGFCEGLVNPEGKTSRLRINCILNSVTRRGPFIANNVGILALFYNFIHGGFLKASGRSSDFASTIGSAAASGLLFRLTAGPKNALLAAVTCATMMGTIDFIKNATHYTDELKTLWQTHSIHHA